MFNEAHNTFYLHCYGITYMVKDYTVRERKPAAAITWATLRLLGLGNGIYVSISMNGSDTPVTRPETDNAGLSSKGQEKKKRGVGWSLGAIEILNTVEKHEWTIKKK